MTWYATRLCCELDVFNKIEDYGFLYNGADTQCFGRKWVKIMMEMFENILTTFISK